MKIIFAGPSIYSLDFERGEVIVRPPAQYGDIARAVEEGATAIGLIDGHYEQVGAAWHKEILYALSSGVEVLGAASMGALRAAECAAFGMLPVGEIAAMYCRGDLYDDAAVAILNGPQELGFPPLTEALVDAEATIARLAELDIAAGAEADALRQSAGRLFFKERTDDAIVERAQLGARGAMLLAAYRKHRVSQKAADALALLALMRQLPNRRRSRPTWDFAQSAFWRQRGAA
jgi:hypothetical protein